MIKLPETELEVMKAVWSAETATTSAYVCNYLKDKKKWTIASILTFLSRLAKKGFITMTKQKKINIYTPNITEKEYLEFLSKDFLERIHNNSLESLLTALYKSSAISAPELKNINVYAEKALAKQ